jgi:hypothetical protein
MYKNFNYAIVTVEVIGMILILYSVQNLDAWLYGGISILLLGMTVTLILEELTLKEYRDYKETSEKYIEQLTKCINADLVLLKKLQEDK